MQQRVACALVGAEPAGVTPLDLRPSHLQCVQAAVVTAGGSGSAHPRASILALLRRRAAALAVVASPIPAGPNK